LETGTWWGGQMADFNGFVPVGMLNICGERLCAWTGQLGYKLLCWLLSMDYNIQNRHCRGTFGSSPRDLVFQSRSHGIVPTSMYVCYCYVTCPKTPAAERMGLVRHTSPPPSLVNPCGAVKRLGREASHDSRCHRAGPQVAWIHCLSSWRA